MAEIKFEIVKRIGVLSTSSKGWTKELNLISWNDREPKYDIREWSPDGTTMGKSVTLTAEELDVLRKPVGAFGQTPLQYENSPKHPYENSPKRPYENSPKRPYENSPKHPYENSPKRMFPNPGKHHFNPTPKEIIWKM